MSDNMRPARIAVGRRSRRAGTPGYRRSVGLGTALTVVIIGYLFVMLAARIATL